MSGNTNHFRLFYQSLVLFVFYRLGLGEDLQYELQVESLRLDRRTKEWGPTTISKFANEDRFRFDAMALRITLGYSFHSNNIEILELVKRSMRFSLLTREIEIHWFINVTFSSDNEAQQFFRDIRSQQEDQWVQPTKIKKIFHYSSDTSQNDEPTLIPLSYDGTFYVKKLEPYWFDNPKSFNFVHTSERGIQEADLVVQSMKFNISPRIGDTTTNADKFFDSVKNDVNRLIACSNDWLTPELIRQINSPVMPDLPHLPDLRIQ